MNIPVQKSWKYTDRLCIKQVDQLDKKKPKKTLELLSLNHKYEISMIKKKKSIFNRQQKFIKINKN